MRGSPHRNLKMFEKLCGTDSLHSVILVTTNWGFLGDQEVAILRKQELQTREEYWGLMVKRGSVVLSHTGDNDSAMNILSNLVPLGSTDSTFSHPVEPVERKRGFSVSSFGREFQSVDERVDQLLAEYTTVVDIPPAKQRRWTIDATH